MAYNYEFPYTDPNRYNSDWILNKVRTMESEWSDFKILNSLKWKGAWNITEQYPVWSIVDVNNNGYLSLQNVPSGIEITNSDYWVKIADYSALYAEVQTRIDKMSGEISPITITGKKFLILGDSISDTSLYPNSWVTSFTERVTEAGGSVSNYSLQGRTLTQYAQNRGNTLIDILPTIQGEYDNIIVFLGVNDYFNQLPLGSVNISVTGNTTFCSSMMVFKNWVCDNQPDARVTFITPLKTTRAGFLAPILLESYCIAIRSYCEFYGYQLIDAHFFAPLINPQDASMAIWQSDGIHPIAAYGPIFSDWILRQIISGSSSIGNASYAMRIEDETGQSINTEVRFNSAGQLWYYVHDYPIRSTGNVKLATIPAQYIPKEVAVGSAWLLNYGIVPLLTISNGLYAVIPADAPTTQPLTGLTGMTTLEYGLNLRINL